MISANSLISVTLGAADKGNPLLNLLGNSAVTLVLATVISLAVSRAGRKREDRRAWRELRHERYSAILERADKASELISDLTENRMPPLTGRERKRLMAEVEEMSGQLYRDCHSIRLMGHGMVWKSLIDVQGAVSSFTLFKNREAAGDVGGKVATLTSEMLRQLDVNEVPDAKLWRN